MTSVKFFKSLAAILALALMLSLLSISVFADGGDAASTASEETSSVSTEEGDAAPDDTEAADAAGDETAEETEAEDADDDDDHDHDHDHDDEEEAGFPWDAVISFGIVIVALLVLFIVYCVNPKFKEKVQNFFRSIKSELKKVVWSSKKDVRKNTIIVLVFVAAFAVMIGLLDFLFSKGIIALGKLF